MALESITASEERIARTLQSLKRNEFHAYFMPDVREATLLLLDAVEQGMKVGLGGSLTLRQMGLPEALRSKGAVLLDHWDDSFDLDETLRTRKDQLLCDLFLSSVNAVTENGELVSRDAVGNRIGAMTFGPGKVMLVAGTQKIVPDLHAAFRRIKEVAAPMRAKSMNLNTPCTNGEGCVDCRDPGRICRATLVLHRRPFLSDVTVILVGEPLGY